MQTIIGAALLWLLGNKDLLILLCSFTFSVGVIHTILSIWRYVEDKKDLERWREF